MGKTAAQTYFDRIKIVFPKTTFTGIRIKEEYTPAEYKSNLYSIIVFYLHKGEKRESISTGFSKKEAFDALVNTFINDNK